MSAYDHDTFFGQQRDLACMDPGLKLGIKKTVFFDWADRRGKPNGPSFPTLSWVGPCLVRFSYLLSQRRFESVSSPRRLVIHWTTCYRNVPGIYVSSL